VTDTLERRLDEIVGGEPGTALTELEELQQTYGWTMAGRRASRLRERLFDLQVDALEDLLAQGKTRNGLKGLEELSRRVIRQDDKLRLEALIVRARLEIRAEELFERVNRPRPSEKDREEFVTLTSADLLDFHLSRLSRQEGVLPPARQLLLEVLQHISSPRRIAVVAKTYLYTEDTKVEALAREILETAVRHRADGHEAHWASIYPMLEEATRDAVTAIKARELLGWLRGR
jgi:hypothetical protein